MTLGCGWVARVRPAGFRQDPNSFLPFFGCYEDLRNAGVTGSSPVSAPVLPQGKLEICCERVFGQATRLGRFAREIGSNAHHTPFELVVEVHAAESAFSV